MESAAEVEAAVADAEEVAAEPQRSMAEEAPEEEEDEADGKADVDMDVNVDADADEKTPALLERAAACLPGAILRSVERQPAASRPPPPPCAPSTTSSGGATVVTCGSSTIVRTGANRSEIALDC